MHICKKIDKETNLALRGHYAALVAESLETETDYETKKQIYKNMHTPKLDEYLYAKFDKNAEAYRTKKWLSDYNKNGFSLTGGVVYFKPTAYKGLQPIDLINSVGEQIKHGKDLGKGKIFNIEVN